MRSIGKWLMYIGIALLPVITLLAYCNNRGMQASDYVQRSKSSIALTREIKVTLDATAWAKTLTVDELRAAQAAGAEPTKLLTKYILDQLNDTAKYGDRSDEPEPHGWTAAGITFVPATGAAQITITPEPVLPIPACGQDDADGCTRKVTSGHCEVHISLPSGRFGQPTGLLDLGTLNHETGHCLGYGHSEEGLMAEPRYPQFQYPSEPLIADLKSRLPQ